MPTNEPGIPNATPAEPYYDLAPQRALRIDRRLLADAVLERLGGGYDEEDGESMREATWRSDEHHREFTLRRQTSEGTDAYWLEATLAVGGPTEYFSFSEECPDIEWSPDESDAESISPDANLALWRQKHAELKRYLASAPVTKPEPHPIWRDLFADVILSIPAGDKRVTEYAQQKLEGRADNQDVAVVFRYLHERHRLNADEAREVIGRATRWARWRRLHGEA